MRRRKLKTWKQHYRITLLHWLSLLAFLASAAFLYRPQTTATAQTPAPAFTVRSYGGKCLEFGALSNRPIVFVFGGTPVFISDCNGSAQQQVRIEELTDRPGHLVILRAGNGVII